MKGLLKREGHYFKDKTRTYMAEERFLSAEKLLDSKVRAY